jgi:DegV family protein with EDD domain
MPKTAIVTDTNSSLSKAVCESLGIIQVPIHIMFGNDTYLTGEDIGDEKLFKMIDEQKALPTTAAPSPNAFQKAFQQAFDQGADQIVCICCSSKVSATYDAAKMAAGEFPGKAILVIDSLQLTLAEGFQVLKAAEMAAEGASLGEIEAAIEKLKPRLHVYGALPTLKYLAMGGRMGKMAAGLADTLNIKPILTAKEGKLELLEKVRTWRKARNRLVQLAVEAAKDTAIKQIGMFHVNNVDGTLELYKDLAKTLPVPEDYTLEEFTPGLSVHAGSGVIGYVLVMADQETPE